MLCHPLEAIVCLMCSQFAWQCMWAEGEWDSPWAPAQSKQRGEGGCDAAGTGCRVQCGRAQSARARCVRAGKGYRAQCRRARGERTKIPRTFRVFTAVAKKTKTLNYILNQLTKSISAILSLCAMFNCWLNNTVYTKYRSFSKDNFFV